MNVLLLFYMHLGGTGQFPQKSENMANKGHNCTLQPVLYLNSQEAFYTQMFPVLSIVFFMIVYLYFGDLWDLWEKSHFLLPPMYSSHFY